MINLESLINLQYCYETLTQIPIQVLVYSHIPTAAFALLFSIFIFIKNRTLISSSLLSVSFLFALWCFLDLNAWFSFMGVSNTMFTWSIIDIVGVLFFLFSFRFIYTFICNKEVPVYLVLTGFILAIPTFVTTIFGLNLSGFDATYCEAIENSTITQITVTTQGIILVGIVVIGIIGQIKVSDRNRKIQNFLATFGVLMFLGFFFTASFIVTLLIDFTAVEYPYNYEIYGLFGMPILIVFLGYLIARFQAFNIKLAGAQALILGLQSLVSALLFVVKSPASQAVVAATFLFAAIAGYFLVRSVKKEIKQREELQVLTEKLATANDRLKELDKLKSEFVSIASHQMRSPLTSMRGYASMLLDGSYGNIPEKAKEAIQRIADSSAFMAKMIENYLNVSRIESGNMKYELSDFNLKLETEKVVDDKRQEAMKKGLLLTFKSNLSGQGIVHADIGKTLEIVHNLLNNALKYTPRGTIDVLVHDDQKKKKIYVDIHDSGIGMRSEDIAKLFGKFERAENANTVNITGTGLGLYVARTMAKAMKGEITAMSEGQDKGSTFRFELPMMM